jgi:PST family polysaccharide transporter
VAIFKLLTILFVFVLIKDPSDAPFVNLLYGSSSLLAGCILYYRILRQYTVSMKFVNILQLGSEFKKGVAIFLSNVGVVVYSNSTVLILSFFVSPTVLGIYSVVEKIIQLCKTSLILVHQVIYPRLCALIKMNEPKRSLF